MIIDDYSPLHDYPLIIDISMGRRRRRRIGTYIQLPEGQASSLQFRPKMCFIKIGFKWWILCSIMKWKRKKTAMDKNYLCTPPISHIQKDTNCLTLSFLFINTYLCALHLLQEQIPQPFLYQVYIPQAMSYLTSFYVIYHSSELSHLIIPVPRAMEDHITV